MKKTMKRSIVTSAILTIALCTSLIAGGTFALFTSESKVNVAVTSGKVNVVAEMKDLSLYSPTAIDQSGTVTNNNNAASENNFANGGMATLEDGTLTLTGVTPGDKASFNIVVTNYSNVSAKYRTVVSCEADDGLLEGLNVTIGGEAYDGLTKVSDYALLNAAGEVATVPVTVELPATAGNLYQNKTFKFTYKVEAVQGNTDTEEPDPNTVYIYNANDLMALQSMTGLSRVEFLNNIDMEGYDWQGLKGGTYGLNFAGSGVEFYGRGFAISNLAKPFIGATTYNAKIDGLTIKDSEMDAFDTGGGWYVNGAFVAYANQCDVELTNCELNNVELNENAKYGGGFVAYFGGDDTDGNTLTIDGCKVINSKVTAQGSVGGFAGHLSLSNAEIKNCSVKNTTVSAKDDSWRVGSVVGTIQTAMTINATESTGNTLEMWDINNPTQQLSDNPGHELFGRIVAPGSLTMGGSSYVTSSYFASILTASNNVTLDKDYVVVDSWTPIYPAQDYVIDGNGKSISGLTAAFARGWYSLTIKNLTIKDSTIGDYNDPQSYIYAGAFVDVMGSASLGSILTLENCHLKNTTVGDGNAKFAGALVGYSCNIGNVTISGCTIDEYCKVKASSEANLGGIIGFVQRTSGAEYKIENCTAKATLNGGEHVGKVFGTTNGDATFTISSCTYKTGDVMPVFARIYDSAVTVDGEAKGPTHS